MSSFSLGAFIGYIGILSELGGALVLVALFAVLLRDAARRPFFAVWLWGWIALAISILALALRYYGLIVSHRWADDFDPRVRAFYVIYQISKLMFYGFSAAGVAMYTRGVRASHALPRLALGLGIYGILTSAPFGGLSEMVQWNAPVAIAAFAVSAWLLIRLPPSRRSVGSTATAVCLVMLAVVWMLYFMAFGLRDLLFDTPLWRLLGFVLQYNSYLDLLLHMLLGYGMVVLLMEDRKREADDAHAVLAAVHDKLRRETLYDPLTGALNRRAFTEGVGLEWANATYGAVAVVDVNNLKPVNDRHGHPTGDELLRRTADVLRGALRASDKLYRWGGDEFLLLLPAARADDVVARLRGAMAGAQPVLVPHSAPVAISASVGAADYIGAESLPSAIERADRAMYEDKHALQR